MMYFVLCRVIRDAGVIDGGRGHDGRTALIGSHAVESVDIDPTLGPCRPGVSRHRSPGVSHDVNLCGDFSLQRVLCTENNASFVTMGRLRTAYFTCSLEVGLPF